MDVVVGGPAEHGRPGDLVAVEVQDRQDGAVAGGIEEADALPRTFERRGLRLTVADHTGDQQVGAVEHRAEPMDERIAELTTFVDRTRRLDADMAGDAARRRE